MGGKAKHLEGQRVAAMNDPKNISICWQMGASEGDKKGTVRGKRGFTDTRVSRYSHLMSVTKVEPALLKTKKTPWVCQQVNPLG